MTTKEFIRRSDYFDILDSACISLSGREFCWKITSISGNTSSVLFTHDVSLFFSEHLAFFVYVNSVYVEQYSKSQFKIDLGYFKSFLSRLSKYQMVSLKDSGKCSHLLAFIDLGERI